MVWKICKIWVTLTCLHHVQPRGSRYDVHVSHVYAWIWVGTWSVWSVLICVICGICMLFTHAWSAGSVWSTWVEFICVICIICSSRPGWSRYDVHDLHITCLFIGGFAWPAGILWSAGGSVIFGRYLWGGFWCVWYEFIYRVVSVWWGIYLTRVYLSGNKQDLCMICRITIVICLIVPLFVELIQ